MRRGIPLLDALKMRQRHNGEEACSSPPCQKRNDMTRRGIYPSSLCRNNKNTTRRGITLPTVSEDEKNERYVPYYWGWARRLFPCPRYPLHHAFSVVLFILWRTRVEGGGGGEGEDGEGEGGWLAIAVELLPSSPLVTKWEITHVMGHGAGNPKPVPRVRVFWGYGIPNPYPYPRETRSKTRDIP